jgi:hypothetical protein
LHYPGPTRVLPAERRFTVEQETTRLGRLRITVKEALKRIWARDTRLEQHRNKLPPIAPQLANKYAKAQS